MRLNGVAIVGLEITLTCDHTQPLPYDRRNEAALWPVVRYAGLHTAPFLVHRTSMNCAH